MFLNQSARPLTTYHLVRVVGSYCIKARWVWAPARCRPRDTRQGLDPAKPARASGRLLFDNPLAITSLPRIVSVSCDVSRHNGQYPSRHAEPMGARHGPWTMIDHQPPAVDGVSSWRHGWIIVHGGGVVCTLRGEKPWERWIVDCDSVRLGTTRTSTGLPGIVHTEYRSPRMLSKKNIKKCQVYCPPSGLGRKGGASHSPLTGRQGS